MRKHAVCIQCHDRPEQINLLMRQFPEDGFDFFIHVDRKSGIQSGIDRRGNVRFVPEAAREDVRWGHWSQVAATLAILRLFDARAYGYVHLISGNDFPIKSARAIHDACDGREFIESKPMSQTSWAWKGLDRVLVRYPEWMLGRPNQTPRRAARIAYREFVLRTGIGKRRALPVPAFYAGSQWFSITGECAAWMLDYLDAHPDYAAFFRTGACMDEIFFPTLARLSPFAGRIANDCRRCIRWTGGKNGGPAVLQEDDLPFLRAHGGFFARKVQSLELCESIASLLCAP